MGLETELRSSVYVFFLTDFIYDSRIAYYISNVTVERKIGEVFIFIYHFLSPVANVLETSTCSYEPCKHVWSEIIVAADEIVMKEVLAPGFDSRENGGKQRERIGHGISNVDGKNGTTYASSVLIY